MKKLLLFLVLIFTTLNVYAEWVLVVKTKDKDIYIKTDSIKRIGHMVQYWSVDDNKSAQKYGDKDYLSAKIKNETNCNTEEQRILFVAVYSESMGSGKVINQYKPNNSESSFHVIIPDTIAHAVFKFVCSKK